MLRVLQTLTRLAIKSGMLEQHVWKLVTGLRNHYSQRPQAIELETRFDDGIRLVASLSSYIESQLFWQGFQEADEGTIKVLKDHLSTDSVFIDVGANIGSFSLVAAKILSKGTGQVIAFEPSEYHVERLAGNIKLNGFENISLNRLGLSDTAGKHALYVPRSGSGLTNTGGATIFRDEDTPSEKLVMEEVELVRLDDFAAEHGITHVDVMKLDIEGAELRALKGSLRLLTRLRPTVLMEFDLENASRSGDSFDELFSFWSGIDYQVWKIAHTGELTRIDSSKDLDAHQNLLCSPVPVSSAKTN